MNGGECRAECQRNFTSTPARVPRLRLLRAPQRAAAPWLKSPKNFPGLWKMDKNYFEMTVWCLAVDLWKKSDVVWVTKCTEYKQNQGKCKRAQYWGCHMRRHFDSDHDDFSNVRYELINSLEFFLLYSENVVIWGKINNISDLKTSLWWLPDESRVKAHFVFSQDPVILNDMNSQLPAAVAL